ncbi:MAG: flavodoxin [Duncaniella sp.]|nr:flavodoxin [Duncaniella sp.]
MKRIFLSLLLLASFFAIQAKTLVVYYSYTYNVHNIVAELSRQIDADVVRIEPAEKGLDYAADNYAIGSAQIAAIRNNPGDAASYPAIDPVNVNLADYDCIIIGAPLWWSQMAAPLQTYLFHNGKAMAGKKIGLIVSSASSGISGVEADARRLIPDGDFLTPSLWIRSSQTSNASSLIAGWLSQIGYHNFSGITITPDDQFPAKYTIFSVDGRMIASNALSLQTLGRGLYIINGKKIYLND